MVIRSIRYVTVQWIWKIIDNLADKQAKGAVLPQGVTIYSDVAYQQTPLKAHLLDIYHPVKVQQPLPVIIYIHGGGFVAGDKKHMQQYCMTLAQAGYCVCNLNYRLAPQHKHPAAIVDVLAAMAWMKDHCDQYFGDRKKVILAGDSAGAYLAASAASISTNPSLARRLNLESPFAAQEIKGVILFCGLFDLVTAASRRFIAIKTNIELFLGTENIRNYPDLGLFSVTGNLTEVFPPTFITSGEVDGLYPESKALANALERHGVEHQTLFFAKKERKAFHGYQVHLKLGTAKQCMERVLSFLENATR